MNSNDTIAALSSPPGRSLRGLLRLCGPAVTDIAQCLLRDRNLELPPPRRLSPARLALPASGAAAAPLELPVLWVRFRAPSSYSGQDMLEVQVPGNPFLLDRVLHYVLDLGARLAEPGEFTFRAFLNRKMDLTEAEGVAATISAVGDAQLQAARLLRQGELGRFARELADRLVRALALVEAGIDFTDQEDVVPITAAALAKELDSAASSLGELLIRCRSYASLGQLPRVVLVGPPSCGKSTLFNTLLGRERAVTTPMPGTTRDVLVEPLTLDTPAGPCEVLLVDIAGLDDPRSALDRQVQQMAREATQQADLLLLLAAPGTGPLPAAAIKSPAPVARIRAMDDLPWGTPPADCDLSVSARTGHNLPALRDLIAGRLADRAVSLTGEALALQPRHESALRSALHDLRHARTLLAAGASSLPNPELIAANVRAALDELAGLAGRMMPDDVLARVFATFCIGK